MAAIISPPSEKSDFGTIPYLYDLGLPVAVKTLRENQLLAERGVALITEIVLAMGYVFRPTSVLDSGIDGEIELRDVQTGRMTNQIIKVQSKATAQFQNETDTGFSFWPNTDDVKYWLGGNVPVILVVSCPDKSEAYWVSVHEYKQANPTTKGIHFDKSRHRLNSSAQSALASLVRDSRYGRYDAPMRHTETLLSNLLPVTKIAERVHIAETDYRERPKLIEALREHTTDFGAEWILRDKRIISFRDLRSFPYTKICDQGTAEDFPIAEWTQSKDQDKQRELVQLMNAALRSKLRPFQIAFENKHPHYCYFFRGNQELKPLPFGYFGGKVETSREVFTPYFKKDGKLRYCRHSAFKAQFQLFDGQWYLEVTPTYYFTRDGLHLSRFYEEPLKGIKRLEHNNAVRGQLIMWIELLTRPADLHMPDYPYLAFGQAETCSIPVGLNDADWLERERGDKVATSNGAQGALELV